ncbi:TolC family protein [Desulfobacterales bacterium HSG16]|nr:TolC family protein [Desulfobacterales bacterium HSG16]
MKAKIIRLTILALFVSSPAWSDYAKLRQDIDSYTHSAYAKSKIEMPQSSESGIISEQSGANDTFEKEKQMLLSEGTGWIKKLEPGFEQSSFYPVSPKVMKKYLPAAKNRTKAAAFLKKRVSLKDLEILSLIRNPGIKAWKKRLRGSFDRYSQTARLDDIIRKYGAFTNGSMTGIGPMKGKDPAKMKFPYPGILSLKGQIVNQDAKAVWESLEASRRDVVTGIRKTYWNIVYVNKDIMITKETLNLLDDLETVVNTRYKSGGTGFQNVIKVTIRQKILKEKLVTLRKARLNLYAKLFELIDLPPDTRPGPLTTVNPVMSHTALSPLYKKALSNRQELLKMRAKIGKSERMIEMAETMILPGYTSNLSFYENDQYKTSGTWAKKEAFSTRTSVSRGAGLPKKPWIGTQDAWLNEARHNLYAMRNDLKKAEAATMKMVRDKWFGLDRALREVTLYKKSILSLSKSALDVSIRGYESGTVPFVDVIDSYTDWFKIRLALERKRSDIGVARAELIRVVGASL